MTAFLNHFAFEFKTGLRNSNLLLMNYLFPLGFYAMMGLVMTEINPMFADSMIPAMVVFGIMVATMLGMPSPLVESREAGILRSYRINGVPALSILFIPAFTTVFHALIVSAVMALTGAPLFGGAAPVNWGAFAMITVAVALSLAGLGALIGVVAGDTRAVILVSQAIFLPSMLIGGLMMPLDLLPGSVKPFSLLLPATHAMQAYQGFAYDLQTVIDPRVSISVLVGGGLLAFALAIHLFQWDSHNRAERKRRLLLALLAMLPYVGTAIALV
ncbi:MAG: ABC transporter permease [Anaerolineae bacterium]